MSQVLKWFTSAMRVASACTVAAKTNRRNVCQPSRRNRSWFCQAHCTMKSTEKIQKHYCFKNICFSMLSRGAVTKFSDIKITFWLSFVVTLQTIPTIFLRLGFSVGLLFTWLNLAPFREFKGQTRGHFVTPKKANRQKLMLTYQFRANLKSVSCIRVRDQPSPSRDELHLRHSRKKKVAAKHLRRKYIFKSSFQIIYTHHSIFSRLRNVP